ncbi:MAG: hypothetical protein JRJ49_03765 [Deltaproteobacteria bacterium]|nr:hypothetical protein [Deltaproteobacteria bacterium]
MFITFKNAVLPAILWFDDTNESESPKLRKIDFQNLEELREDLGLNSNWPNEERSISCIEVRSQFNRQTQAD